MKTKRMNLFYVAVAMLLTFATVKSYALNYTISFTASGASSTVGSVQVKNLTKGTTVTVPGGNTLTLTDVTTAVQGLSIGDNNCRIVQNSSNGSFDLSLNAAETDAVNVDVYSLDGRKVVGVTKDLQAGKNSFELLLRKGMFVVRVSGKGINYSNKIINQTNAIQQAKIKYLGYTKVEQNAPQKSKTTPIQTTNMTYTTGDQLLYTAVSGIYSNIVTDTPTGSKTTNFEFVACTDADGNNYTTVKIGTQTWMAENLRTTKYRTSESVSNVSNTTLWSDATFGAWCNYDNLSANGTNYGHLYNWYAAIDSRNIAPVGWHVPNDAEWTTLTTLLGGDAVAGGKLKDIGTIYWTTPNFGATNESGFTGLPGGYRTDDGSYGVIGGGSYWWSSSENNPTNSWYRYIYKNYSDVYKASNGKASGFSVRCIKNDVPTITTTYAASAITITTATSGGEVTFNGGAIITARGICWSTTPAPTTILSTKTIETGTSGQFSSSMTGLIPNTTYYVRAYASNSTGTGYGDELIFTTASLQMGTEYAGGIVFYIDETGKHGLVCAPIDQYYGSWGYYGINVPGNKSTAFGAGAANTALIVATGLPSAAKVCDDLVLNSFDDWYLPSLDELTMMKDNLYKKGIGGFSTYYGGYYWSSSAPLGSDDWNAYYETMMGNPYYSYRNSQKNVRAIRNF